jgi:hypothetical protein
VEVVRVWGLSLSAQLRRRSKLDPQLRTRPARSGSDAGNYGAGVVVATDAGTSRSRSVTFGL